jgi:outer membrane murein-binding lipoprotein Lpp
MTTAEQVLVIFLSAALAVFLVLGIMALIKVNQILDQVRKVTAKAEKIADQAEHVGEFFKNTTTSAAVGKLVANIFSAFKSSKNKDTDE